MDTGPIKTLEDDVHPWGNMPHEKIGRGVACPMSYAIVLGTPSYIKVAGMRQKYYPQLLRTLYPPHTPSSSRSSNGYPLLVYGESKIDESF